MQQREQTCSHPDFAVRYEIVRLKRDGGQDLNETFLVSVLPVRIEKASEREADSARNVTSEGEARRNLSDKFLDRASIDKMRCRACF